MKKQNLTERTFWICEKCGKEHELKFRFCDQCGTYRTQQTNKRNYIKYFLKDDKRVDYIIIAFSILLFFFTLTTMLFAEIVGSICVWIALFAILLLIPAAFIRLFICKFVKLWLRLITLISTIIFNPILLFLILGFIFVPSAKKTKEQALKKINMNCLVSNCVEIASKPQLYQGKYLCDNLSNLPEYIQEINPVYVWVNEESIMIALMGGMSHYGWKFDNSDSNKWNLYWYDDIHKDLLVSNVVVNY